MHEGISLYRAADLAAESFFQWASSSDESETGGFTCMFDHIYDWVENGSGAADCLLDFQTFLTAVTLIIAAWQDKEPEDYPHMTTITKVMDPERRSYELLNPQTFMLAVAQNRESHEIQSACCAADRKNRAL